MPSHTNPNTPSSAKPRRRAAQNAKRRRTAKQRIAKSNKTPRTSAAIRKAAPPSNKKARKLDRKMGYAKQRALEDEFERREVEMRDVKDTRKAESGKENLEEGEERMDVDAAG